MKKIRKIICIVIALISVFAITGVAYASEWRNSPKVYWGPKTSDSFYASTTYKAATYFWEDFTVHDTYAAYVPDPIPGYVQEFYGQPYTQGGVAMGPRYGCMMELSCNIPCTANGGENYVKVRISSFYANYATDMTSQGYFYGTYS